MENKEPLKRADQPNQQQNNQGLNESATKEQAGNRSSAANGLVPQKQPLKNNDRDVDPSDPRHSSLGHR